MRDEYSGLALREGGFVTFTLPAFYGDNNRTTIEIYNSINKGRKANRNLLGLYSDCVYVPLRDRYLVYDVLNMKILQVDQHMLEIEDLVYNVKGSLSPARTLAYDEVNNILFVNFDDFKIMYFKLNEGNDFTFSYMDVVEVYGVERITDFSVMSGNRLVVLTRDG